MSWASPKMPFLGLRHISGSGRVWLRYSTFWGSKPPRLHPTRVLRNNVGRYYIYIILLTFTYKFFCNKNMFLTLYSFEVYFGVYDLFYYWISGIGNQKWIEKKILPLNTKTFNGKFYIWCDIRISSSENDDLAIFYLETLSQAYSSNTHQVAFTTAS